MKEAGEVHQKEQRVLGESSPMEAGASLSSRSSWSSQQTVGKLLTDVSGKTQAPRPWGLPCICVSSGYCNIQQASS